MEERNGKILPQKFEGECPFRKSDVMTTTTTSEASKTTTTTTTTTAGAAKTTTAGASKATATGALKTEAATGAPKTETAPMPKPIATKQWHNLSDLVLLFPRRKIIFEEFLFLFKSFPNMMR